MIAFLFFAIIASSLATFYRFKNQIAAQRKQIILLKYENDKLKHKLKNQN
jgi:cell division protein FtsB